MFIIGQKYTRKEISSEVGGGLMDCLSHCGNRVVAVCLKREMNPEAPFKMLVGCGPDKERYSEILCNEQGFEAVPIFVKAAINEWEFYGNFTVSHFSKDPAIVAIHEETAGRRDVYMVINFEEV